MHVRARIVYSIVLIYFMKIFKKKTTTYMHIPPAIMCFTLLFTMCIILIIIILMIYIRCISITIEQTRLRAAHRIIVIHTSYYGITYVIL